MDEAGLDGGSGARIGIGMGMGAPSMPSDPYAAQVVAPQPGFALLGLDSECTECRRGRPTPSAAAFCCLRGMWPALASRVRLVSAKREKCAGERCLCGSGPRVVGREYRWLWVPVMVFTPEPDPLELVCDSDDGGGGSAGSLDWPAPYQVQCLVQVQVESELRLEPECACGNPIRRLVTNTKGTPVARPRTASNILSNVLSLAFLAFPTSPAPIIPEPAPLAHPAWSVGA